MVARVVKIAGKEKKEKIEAGWLHINVLFELVGNPKDHIEKTLQSFLDNINEDENIICIKEELEETISVGEDDNLFSAVAEVEYLILGLEKVTWFAFNFMPASIEIKAPKEVTFKDRDFSAWMNDLLAKLHEVNALHTSLKSEHQQLIKNLNISIRNSILLAVEHEAFSAAEIAKKVGIGEEVIEQFLVALIKDNKVAENKKKYSRV